MGKILSLCAGRNDPDIERPRKPKNHDANKNNKKTENNTASHQTNGVNAPTNGAIPTSHRKPDKTDIWLTNLQSKMNERLRVPLELYYKMDHGNRGLCLIFNHETFDDTTLRVRKGTQVDRERLFKTFTALGFDVRDFHNSGEMEIRAILKKVSAMDHTNNDCLVVIVLSHGELVPYYDYRSGDESNTILSHDLMSYVHSKNSMYPLQMICLYFTDENCPSLANKPRIFLIQACQGNKTDPGMRFVSMQGKLTESDGGGEEFDNIPFQKIHTIQPMAMRAMSIDETDGVPYEPIKIKPILPQKDFLIVYASLPGFYSFRNTLNGAWFIQSLCRELDERDVNLDFMQILTLANQRVAYDYESHSYDSELDLKKQIPCISSMFTKLLVFPKTERIKNGY